MKSGPICPYILVIHKALVKALITVPSSGNQMFKTKKMNFTSKINMDKTLTATFRSVSLFSS